MDCTHPDISCDYCENKPIKGPRYVCLVCNDYDLCQRCYRNKRRSEHHRGYHPMQKVLPRVEQIQLETRSKPDSSPVYCCPYCGDRNFTASKLQMHVYLYHTWDSKEVHCPVCVVHHVLPQGEDQQSPLTVSLMLHLGCEHRELESVSSCTVCGGLPISHGCLVCEDYYLCDLCYQSKSYTSGHRPYHPMQPIPLIVNQLPTQEQRFVCPYCGDGDLTAMMLWAHCVLYHSEDRANVRCPICTVRRVPFGFWSLLKTTGSGKLVKHLRDAHKWVNERDCAICMEKVTANHGKNLVCGHQFHARCIGIWLQNRNSCPVCRNVVEE